MRTYIYQHTPPFPVRTLYGRSLILYMCIFFLYHKNVGPGRFHEIPGIGGIRGKL